MNNTTLSLSYKEPSKNVLFFDSEKETSINIIHTLKGYGYETNVLYSHEGILKKIKHIKTEIIFINACLKQDIGFNLLHKIKKAYPQIICVMIMGNTKRDTNLKRFTEQADEFLYRPLNLCDLLATLERCFEKIRSNRLKNKININPVKCHSYLEQINNLLQEVVDPNLSANSHIEDYGSCFLERFGKFMTAAGGSLYLNNMNGLRLLHSIDPGHAKPFIRFPLRNESVFKQVITERKSLLVQDIKRRNDIVPSGWDNYHDNSTLVFPLQSKNDTITGLLSFHNKENSSFDQQDLALGTLLASYSQDHINDAYKYDSRQENNNKNHHTEENISKFIWTMDTNMKFSYVSPSIKHILGCTAEEIKDSSIKEWLSPDSIEIALKAFEQAVAGKTSDSCSHPQLNTMELKYVPKNGSTIWTKMQIYCLHNLKGKAVGFIGIAHDISKQKIFEEKKRTQMIQQQKMASIGKLTCSISHDINNILTSIIGFADLTMLEISKDNSLRKNLEIISDEGRRASGLINQLLAFSRNQAIEPKILNINAVIKNLQNMLTMIVKKNISLRNIMCNGLWNIKADRYQMEQIIINLIVNAVDAMPRGGGNLTIKTNNIVIENDYFMGHNLVEKGDYARLIVSDTGHGMTEEVKKHIFELFFTTKERGKGTGLGLATVYKTVKQNNGFIDVQSEPEQGTIFEIYLPRIEEESKLGLTATFSGVGALAP